MNDALREYLSEPRYRTVRQYRPEFGITRIYEVMDYVHPTFDIAHCAVKDKDGVWHPYYEGGMFPAVTRVDSPTDEDLACVVGPGWND